MQLSKPTGGFTAITPERRDPRWTTIRYAEGTWERGSVRATSPSTAGSQPIQRAAHARHPDSCGQRYASAPLLAPYQFLLLAHLRCGTEPPWPCRALLSCPARSGRLDFVERAACLPAIDRSACLRSHPRNKLRCECGLLPMSTSSAYGRPAKKRLKLCRLFHQRQAGNQAPYAPRLRLAIHTGPGRNRIRHQVDGIAAAVRFAAGRLTLL